VVYRPVDGKDLERNETAVAIQRRGKHVSITVVTVGNGVSYSVRAKGL
jgi:hypothetical protein